MWDVRERQELRVTAKLPSLMVIRGVPHSWDRSSLNSGHPPLCCVYLLRLLRFLLDSWAASPPGSGPRLLRFLRTPFQALSSLRLRCIQVMSSAALMPSHRQLTHKPAKGPALLGAPDPQALTPLRPRFLDVLKPHQTQQVQI